MSLRDLSIRHLRLISTYGARYSVRGGSGLVFLLLVLLTGLLVAHMLLTPVEMAKTQMARDGEDADDAELVEILVDRARPAVAWAIRSRTDGASAEEEKQASQAADRWTDYLLDERPALLSAILLILVFSLPFLVAVGAFNQFSGDVQSRGLRYQLLRTERANIFFGRFIGTSLFSIMVMALLIATISLYLGIKIRIYAPGDLLVWSLLGFAALSVLTVPYVAFCSWISAHIDSPIGSLSISSLIIGAVPLFAVIGRNSWEHLTKVNYLMPWGIQNYLLHSETGTVLLAMAGCLGYTALYLTLGYRHFAKRDL